MIARHLGPSLCLALTLVVVGRAHADASEQTVALAIADDDRCPARAAIVEQLTHLVPGVVMVETAADARVRAAVRDLGDRYEMKMDRARMISDPRRRCVERARTVALMLALALDPERSMDWTIPDQLEGSVDDETPAPPLVTPSPIVAAPPVAAPPPVAPPPATRKRYPMALIDRPLALPRGSVVLAAETTLERFDPHLPRLGAQYGGVQVVSASVGVGGHTELGLSGAMPFIEDLPVGGLFSYARFELPRNVALRVDFGFQVGQFDANTTARGTAFIGAIAIEQRWRINRYLALTTGGLGLRRVWQVQSAQTYAFQPASSTDALLSVIGDSQSGFHAWMFLPVGLLVQPHPMIAFHFQTGARFYFDDVGLELSGTQLPIGVDLVVTPHPRLDVGGSVELPGYLNHPYGGMVNAAAFFRARI